MRPTRELKQAEAADEGEDKRYGQEREGEELPEELQRRETRITRIQIIGRGPAPHRRDQEELQLWHAPEVYWPVANRSVRVVKTVRTQRKNRIRVGLSDTGRRSPQKEMVVEQSTNFYASNLELGTIPPGFVHQLGRSRWVIDTEAFQTITTDGPSKNIRA